MRHLFCLAFLFFQAPLWPAAAGLSPSASTLQSGSAALSPAAEPLLPVLCYHRFGREKKGDPYQISAEHLERQLRWLRSQGYQSVRLADVLGGFTRTAKPILITVDDGFESGWSVGGSVFERQGFTAVYFLHPKLMRARGRISWAQARAMEAKGFEIGCHSQAHSNLARPGEAEDAKAYATRLADEITESKRLLEKGLGHPVSSFAYPYGAWNRRVERLVKEAGYTIAFTATRGVVRQGDPAFELKRLLQIGYLGPKAFKRAVQLRPAGIRLEGVTEGDSFAPGALFKVAFRSEAEWPKPLQAWMDGEMLSLVPQGELRQATIQAPSKQGFHVIKVVAGVPEQDRETQWLIQVAPQHCLPLLR